MKLSKTDTTTSFVWYHSEDHPYKDAVIQSEIVDKIGGNELKELTRSFIDYYKKVWQTKLEEDQVSLDTRDVMTMVLMDRTQGQSGLTDDLTLKVHHYVAKYYGDKPLVEKLAVLKYMLHELWVHQCVPYMLFS